MENLKKFLIEKLPGLSSYNKKIRNLAWVLYFLTVLLWVFCIYMLFYSLFFMEKTTVSEKPNNIYEVKKDLTEIEGEKKQQDLKNIEDNRTIIISNDDNILVRTPSSKNSFKSKKDNLKNPKLKNFDTVKFEPVTEDEKFIGFKKVSVLEDSKQYKNFNMNIIESEAVNTGLQDEKKIIKPDNKLKKKPIKENKTLKKTTPEKINKVRVKENRNIKSNVTKKSKKQNKTQKNKNVSEKTNQKVLNKKSEVSAKVNNVKKNNAEKSTTGNKQIQLNTKYQETKLSNYSQEQPIPVNLTNKKENNSFESLEKEKHALTSGMDNYTRNKDLLIEPETYRLQNPVKKSETENRTIELKKFKEYEYNPIDKK